MKLFLKIKRITHEFITCGWLCLAIMTTTYANWTPILLILLQSINPITVLSALPVGTPYYKKTEKRR